MRNRSILICISIIMAALAVCSCTVESSDNGRLDGAWHLLSINEQTPDHPDLYWNIQGKLLEMNDKTSDFGIFIMRFSRDGNQLTLSNPHIFDRESGDKELEDATALQPFGVDNINEPFQISSLTRSRMTLKSSTKTLEFRKL